MRCGQARSAQTIELWKHAIWGVQAQNAKVACAKMGFDIVSFPKGLAWTGPTYVRRSPRPLLT